MAKCLKNLKLLRVSWMETPWLGLLFLLSASENGWHHLLVLFLLKAKLPCAIKFRKSILAVKVIPVRKQAILNL